MIKVNKKYRKIGLIFLFFQIFLLLIIPSGHSQQSGSWRYKFQSNTIATAFDEVHISSNGNHIIAGNLNKLYFFNRSRSTPIWIYETDDFINSVAISADGSIAATGTRNGTTYCFKTFDYNLTTSLITPFWYYSIGTGINVVSITGDGTRVVSGGTGIYLFNNTDLGYVFNSSAFQPLYSYPTGLAIDSLDISSDGNYVVVGMSSEVLLLNGTNLNYLWSYSIGGYSISISADGSLFAVGSLDNHVYVFNSSISTPKWNYTTLGYVTEIAISGDSAYITAGGQNNRLYLFNSSGSTPEWNYEPGNDVNSVAISLDGRYIATGVRDASTKIAVLIFNRSSATPILNLAQTGQTNSIDISADGRYIIAKAGYDFTMYDRENPTIISGGAIDFYIIPGMVGVIGVMSVLLFRMRKRY
ncbi:MAG: WD40 repeat domain-containing protein [Candidatus Thorarchaeota archaeon]